jgi:protease I
MEPSTAKRLQGKRVAVLMTDGVEQVEYTEPRGFLEVRGAEVTLVSPKRAGEEIQAFKHLTPASTFKVERNLDDVSPDHFDALVLPGGVANPDMLRLSERAINFIREFSVANKPIAAICHGPWTLINADVVAGKRVTSWPSLEVDLRNAGAEWVDQEVVIEGKLITSRKPADIPAFNQALLVVLEEADVCPPGLAGRTKP